METVQGFARLCLALPYREYRLEMKNQKPYLTDPFTDKEAYQAAVRRVLTSNPVSVGAFWNGIAAEGFSVIRQQIPAEWTDEVLRASQSAYRRDKSVA